MPAPWELAKLLRETYRSPGSLRQLAEYVQSRLPPQFSSAGDLVPLPGGTGRKAFTLGDDLVVKAARLPRGVMENRLAQDTYAPIPELQYSTDDDLMTVVKRAQPVDSPLRQAARNIQKQYAEARWPSSGEPGVDDPRRNAGFVDALYDAGFGKLMNYSDPMWGDIMPRNIGRLGGNPVLLDEGILDRGILNPQKVMSDVPLDFWNNYRQSVMNKAQGGLVSMQNQGNIHA